jgi:hypothetical protein
MQNIYNDPYYKDIDSVIDDLEKELIFEKQKSMEQIITKKAIKRMRQESSEQ